MGTYLRQRAARCAERDLEKCGQLAGLFEESGIPNADRLVRKLWGEPEEEDFLNALTAWALHKNGRYAVTDLEAGDVSVQLDGHISVQSYVMTTTFRDMGGRSAGSGGAPTEWDRDRGAVFEKLVRLPDDGLGIVLAWSEWVIFDCLPGWFEDIPPNKCVLNVDRSTVMHNARHSWPWKAQSDLNMGIAPPVYCAQGFQSEHPNMIADILSCPATLSIA